MPLVAIRLTTADFSRKTTPNRRLKIRQWFLIQLAAQGTYCETAIRVRRFEATDECF